ncbi:MAG TPA: lipoate--protein ligase [Candidatus Limiplasma sp.]|nr:lipoate--protein ligase [Candidatus Limiplasma sp.]HPS81341.1 lipoate--protein ligase [Candidatus Limiplasma sp.]
MIRRTACLIARQTDPFRNLAIEKHLMDTLPEETAILYLWQNSHTIVVGRNQNPWYECRVDEFLESGGKIARRLSGGGAVYHDMGNLNFTFILPKTDFDVPKQLTVIRRAVAAFDLEAFPSGRNDLLIGDRKFSGNAFYKAGHSAYHHGTLLVDCDMALLGSYLIPSEKKMQYHGVQSVQSRVVNLRSLTPEITIDSLEGELFQAFADVYQQKPAVLDERMLDQRTLHGLTEQFSDPEWIYPQALPYTFTVTERFPWGGVTVKLLVENGVIRNARLFTDAMEAGLFTLLEQALTGCPYLISAINGRLRQKLELLRDHQLLQMAGDVGVLICGRIRELDRNAQQEAGAAANPANG